MNNFSSPICTLVSTGWAQSLTMVQMCNLTFWKKTVFRRYNYWQWWYADLMIAMTIIVLHLIKRMKIMIIIIHVMKCATDPRWKYCCDILHIDATCKCCKSFYLSVCAYPVNSSFFCPKNVVTMPYRYLEYFYPWMMMVELYVTTVESSWTKFHVSVHLVFISGDPTGG